jgi:dihydrolipoamide dehydrogenase
MAKQHVRNVIIGAGPGGYVAAIRLAQLGQEVLVIEKAPSLGGVCLNWGCIPSKALIHAASTFEGIKHASAMGISVGEPTVDLAKMMTWKDGIVSKLTGGIAQLFKANGVQKMHGTASFVDKNTLKVTDESGTVTTVTFEQCMIATGSSSIEVPGFKYDGETIISSNDAVNLQQVPESLALIGGGVIGLELGIFYSKLGTKVTVVEMQNQVLPGMDADIVKQLSRSLKKRKMTVYTDSRAEGVSVKGGLATVKVSTPKGDKTIEADKVLVAVGRKPNSQGLGLEKAGITVNDRGFIVTNEQLKTSVPHIFAIGDVTSGPLLAHKASKEGLVAAAVMAGDTTERLDVRAMPGAVFTDPEIATVGYTEAQAKENGYEIVVGAFPFAASGRAMTMEHTEGMVKIITDKQTDLILGVHMIGPHVAELLAEATLAIEMGATAEDLALTVHAHPTLSEGMMEAAEAVHGLAIHIAQPKKPALSK